MAAKPSLAASQSCVQLAKPASSGAYTARQHAVAIGLCALAAVLISLLISAHYLPYVFDDALISYRYSDRLLHGLGLTWNDGEFVEGYSNLLWVLLVAAAGLLQPDFVLAGWILGALANTATILAIAWAFGRPSPTWPIALASCLVGIAFSEIFAFAAVGGLETGLLCALLAWALAAAWRMPAEPRISDRLWPALLFGLLAITRPDGALFGVSAALAELLRNGISRRTIKTAVAFGGTPVVFVALQVAFRLAYYDALLPNTASVKLAFSIERILNGLSYVGHGAFVNSAILMAILIASFMLWRAKHWEALVQSTLFVIPGVAWLAYVCLIGGDYFPFDRHWLPAFICAVFAMGGLLTKLPSVRLSITCGIILALALAHIATQSTINPYRLPAKQLEAYSQDLRRELHRIDPTGKLEREMLSAPPLTRAEARQKLQDSYRICPAIGSVLKIAFDAQQPIIAVNAAGCLPYFTGFPAIDMLGLNDAHIAHHRPPDIGKGLIGHELGDGAYVLSRRPDLIVFCANGSIGPGIDIPCFRSDRDIYGSPQFRRDYRLLHYRAGDHDLSYWTRVEGGRIGITRSQGQIEIPGFLLAATPDASVEVDPEGKAVTALRIGEAHIHDISIPPGAWEVLLDTGGNNTLQLATRPEAGSEIISARLLRITSSGELRSFTVLGGPGLIYAIRARRL